MRSACPIAGVATGRRCSLRPLGRSRDRDGRRLVLLQPAGPSDRVLSPAGEPPVILPGGTDPDLRAGERLVAVDLAGRAPDDAVALGEAAHAGLAAALLPRAPPGSRPATRTTSPGSSRSTSRCRGACAALPATTPSSSAGARRERPDAACCGSGR